MASQNVPIAIELDWGYPLELSLLMYEEDEITPIPMTGRTLFVDIRKARSPSQQVSALVARLSGSQTLGTATGVDITLTAAEVMALLPESVVSYDFELYINEPATKERLANGTMSVKIPTGQHWEITP
jgi:hypothetical protein